MSVEPTVVVVGGGQAGAVAARTLRRRGHGGPIVLVGDEPHRPYQRPPLSKEYLAEGDAGALELLPESWTEAQDVEVRTGVRALKIDARDRSVLLDDGSSVPADHVLLATGGRARTLDEAAGDRIHYLRTRTDADALSAQLVPGAHLVIVGGGFIGAEVASTARSRGVDVTVLEAGAVPLGRALGAELGTRCGRLMTEAGVDLRLGSAVTGVVQDGADVVVHTTAGPVAGSCALVGIGMVPNDELARASGIDVGDGVLVDDRCRTSMPQVYAAGDVAHVVRPDGRRGRVEHFDNASRQAAVAVDTMLGRDVRHDDQHWFWSDQFGANLQLVGERDGADRVVVRGDMDGDCWAAFFLADGLVRGAFAMNDGESIAVARELATFGVQVAPETLADPNVDLMEVLE